jgi:hypothetical protein
MVANKKVCQEGDLRTLIAAFVSNDDMRRRREHMGMSSSFFVSNKSLIDTHLRA